MSDRILIVDDEPLITITLETFLNFSLDAEIITTNDPFEAVKIAEEKLPDMVISDFMMPGLNGLQLLKKVREVCPDAVTILLTGYADKENAIKCINEVGLYYYAEKPWDNAAFLKIVENGLEKRQMQKLLQEKVLELEKSNTEIARLYGLLKNDFALEVDNLQNLMITLANLIESKDRYTDGHTRRVGFITKIIGQRLGIEGNRLKNLEMSGIIHDIGKVGVSESILNKAAKLTEQEYEEMKRHTILGHHICLPLNILKGCLDPIRHHHEKLDGSGYPDGLKGDQISIESRIVAVADIFDALYSDRPYRSKLDIESVKRILWEEVENCKLDRSVVKTLIEVYDSKMLGDILDE